MVKVFFHMKRRRVSKFTEPEVSFSEKYSSKLAKPFENSDSIIVAGKLQKLSYGLHIRIAKDSSDPNPILDLFLGSYTPPRASDTDVTPDPNPTHSLYFLNRNEYFLIQITATPALFEIEINGRPYVLEREHSEDSAQFLKIGGSIAFLTQVQHRAANPVEWPLWQSSNVVRSENYFLSDFPVQMQAGQVVVITALPYGISGGSLEICLTQDAHPVPALKLCAEFGEPQSVTLMGMDSEQELQEEQRRDSPFPFQINRKFRLAIGFTLQCFVLAINGNNYASFRYRTSNLPSSLNGYYMRTTEPLKVKIISTDHVNSGSDSCDGFEGFSDFSHSVD